MGLLPLVSVLIPAHNGEKHLGDAILSALMQDYGNKEVWVIDNGSMDHTGQIAKGFSEVRYEWMEEANTAMARNRGLECAKGEYVAFLDQDDTWPKEKLRLQVDFLENNREYGGVIGKQQMYLEANEPKPHWLKRAFLDAAQEGYLPSALMLRRKDLSYFDASLPLASDVAWFMNAKHAHLKIGSLPEVVVYRRIHSKNASNRHFELQGQILRAIQNSLKARRDGAKS